MSAKVSEIGLLTKEVESQKSMLADLQQQLETQKKKNNVSLAFEKPFVSCLQ